MGMIIDPYRFAATSVSGFGALVTKSVDQTAADYHTSGQLVAFDSQIYQYGTWHSTSVNNTRLTVPTGVTKVRLSGQVGVAAGTSDKLAKIYLYKNGTTMSPYISFWSDILNATPRTQIMSPVLSVSPGDYFELYFYYQDDTSITIDATETWFAIEMVG